MTACCLRQASIAVWISHVEQTIPAPRAWSEYEERARGIAALYCGDPEVHLYDGLQPKSDGLQPYMLLIQISSGFTDPGAPIVQIAGWIQTRRRKECLARDADRSRDPVRAPTGRGFRRTASNEATTCHECRSRAFVLGAVRPIGSLSRPVPLGSDGPFDVQNTWVQEPEKRKTV